ncbi:MAG: ankyrin repeat domain-containing protein [Acidobacteria bacterium]|nr:ankyrin repeat domain-containing protein [Acidobacteriota bacterium]
MEGVWRGQCFLFERDSNDGGKTFAQYVNDELIVAARKSNVQAVKELLAKGADPNAKTQYGATPLFFACDRGSLEIVQMLVNRGADVTAC